MDDEQINCPEGINSMVTAIMGAIQFEQETDGAEIADTIAALEFVKVHLINEHLWADEADA